MIRLTDTDLMPADEAEALAGTFLDLRRGDRVIRDTETVLKPDGSPLLVYVRDAIPRRLCETAYEVFGAVKWASDNRGQASGDARYRPMKRDGTRSRTTQARTVPSGIVGAVDRSPRYPVCRLTSFNLDHYREFARVKPFFREIGQLFARHAPEQYARQRAFVDRIAPDFVIQQTPFTTATVNDTWQTACHRDAGDYRAGFGALTVLEAGRYSGGELIFPRYRTAVDLRTGGLLLADVHELHGNAALTGEPGRYRRLSVVCYARERMAACLSARDERERAKRLDDCKEHVA
jgi:hypothetical protein